jgi:hypothetical protein
MKTLIIFLAALLAFLIVLVVGGEALIFAITNPLTSITAVALLLAGCVLWHLIPTGRIDENITF